MIIDVSQFQGEIDWDKVKPEIEGAIIRIGYRGYGSGKIVYDPQYKRNRAEVERMGIPHSFYFFPTSVTDAEAHEEAEFIRTEVTGAELSYPVFLDSEMCSPKHDKRSDILSSEDRTHYLKIILDDLKTAGINAGVYASTNWLNDRLDMSTLTGYPVWVAQYAKTCTYEGRYDLWQYTSGGHLDGIPGKVDCSVKAGETDQATDSKPQTAAPLKSIDEIAHEVINGAWGAGDDRRNRLTAAGYDYAAVQAKVNELCKPKEPPIPQIAVDGYFGPATIKRMQNFFGTTEDGVISKPSSVIMALQRWLGGGIAVDGYLGPRTIRRWQQIMGTTQDGTISRPSQLIKAWQKYLNTHRHT